GAHRHRSHRYAVHDAQALGGDKAGGGQRGVKLQPRRDPSLFTAIGRIASLNYRESIFTGKGARFEPRRDSASKECSPELKRNGSLSERLNFPSFREIHSGPHRIKNKRFSETAIFGQLGLAASGAGGERGLHGPLHVFHLYTKMVNPFPAVSGR